MWPRNNICYSKATFFQKITVSILSQFPTFSFLFIYSNDIGVFLFFFLSENSLFNKSLHAKYTHIYSLTVSCHLYLWILEQATSRASGASSEWRMLFYVYLCFLALLLLLFLFSIKKSVFLSFSFLFLMNYQISATGYSPICNRNWW